MCRYFLLPSIALSVVFAALAQTASSTGAIQGTIVDPTGAVIVGARITARHVDLGTIRTAETDASGQFRLAGLHIGNYTMRVEREGFGSVEVSSFLVSVGQTVVQHLTLQLAGVGTKMEVRERSDAVDIAASTSNVALGYDRIEEAPAPNRNYLNFVNLAPGVSASSGSSSQRSVTGVRSPLADSGFSFAGLRGRNNSISVDGVDNRDETTGERRVAVGVEVVQEFLVFGVSVGAEVGGAAGGLVNMVTRSGVNLWHGDFTFFSQNERFNARGPEVESAMKPRFRRYQPGTSLNGPIRKDRIFFSAAIEYERESGQEFSETPEGAEQIINR